MDLCGIFQPILQFGGMSHLRRCPMAPEIDKKKSKPEPFSKEDKRVLNERGFKRCRHCGKAIGRVAQSCPHCHGNVRER